MFPFQSNGAMAPTAAGPMGQPQNPFAQQILQAIAARRAAMMGGQGGMPQGFQRPMGQPAPQQPMGSPMPVGQMDFSKFAGGGAGGGLAGRNVRSY